jgi:hypothetical protein
MSLRARCRKGDMLRARRETISFLGNRWDRRLRGLEGHCVLVLEEYARNRFLE